ncbi:MAG: hypothetical protein WAM14_25370 [Candidatus Nitrosopolaris sp.]
MTVWSSYNETLIKRGEIVLDFDFIDGWYKELETMNDGKKCEPYLYPDSFIAAWIHASLFPSTIRLADLMGSMILEKSII